MWTASPESSPSESSDSTAGRARAVCTVLADLGAAPVRDAGLDAALPRDAELLPRMLCCFGGEGAGLESESDRERPMVVGVGPVGTGRAGCALDEREGGVRAVGCWTGAQWACRAPRRV